jgi:hypothetical protein
MLTGIDPHDDIAVRSAEAELVAVTSTLTARAEVSA